MLNMLGIGERENHLGLVVRCSSVANGDVSKRPGGELSGKGLASHTI
jgi:hypothetical protein